MNVFCIPKSDCWCLFVPLFLHFSFSPIFNITCFRHTSFRNCEAYKLEIRYTHGQRVNVACVLESDCCCLFIPLFIHFSFQFSNKSFYHTFLRNYEAYKVETRYSLGQRLNVSCILESDCSRLFITSFLHFSFSPILIHLHFCYTFLRNYEAYKVETWYTRGQRIDVLCIPKSGCCCLFVPLFLHFSFSSFQTLKVFRRTFIRNCEPSKLKLGTHVDNG